MNRLQRLILRLLPVDSNYEVRSASVAGRNTFGTLLLQTQKYGIAKAKFDKALANSVDRYITLRHVSTLQMGAKFSGPTTVTELPNVTGEASTWTSETSPAETSHPMSDSLPYPAPDGYTGQDHMCDTAGGLVVMEPSGIMGPCCSVCGQPTD